MKIFFCTRSDLALPERALRSSPLPASLHYAVTSSRVSTPCPGVALAKTDPLAVPRQNTPGCAISLLISGCLAGENLLSRLRHDKAFPRSIRLISPISPILRTPAPLRIKLRYFVHGATNWSANTPLFLKGGGGMGEGILRCRRLAFSREKNFPLPPISQRFSNKKKTRRRQFRGKTLAPPPQGCGAMSAIISDYIT